MATALTLSKSFPLKNSAYPRYLNWKPLPGYWGRKEYSSKRSSGEGEGGGSRDEENREKRKRDDRRRLFL